MSYYILAVNPGSTTTKAALYRDEQPLFDFTIEHTAEELGCYQTTVDQFEWRHDLILYRLEQEGFNISKLSAVIGRGGLTKPIEGGVYNISDELWHDTKHATIDHACNLGVLIARSVADSIGVPAYTADPAVIDEMDPVARISGLPETPRRSIFHALNTRATSRMYAQSIGKRIEDLNLIIAHMGGGVTVSMHSKGRVIDTFCGVGGDGSFSPERSGRIASDLLIDMCFSGKYTQRQMHRKILGEGGVVAHLGTNSMREAMRRVKASDEKAKMIVDAFAYNVSKDIGAMSTTVCGDVDGIILTGGIAHNEYITSEIERRCKYIAPIFVYPGENELQALAFNALLVLKGEIEAKEYL